MPLSRVEVRGDSMRPALEPGDRLLVVRGRAVRVGDGVALDDPRQPARTMVKRVAGRGDGGVTVLGDNPGASTDSRAFGPVAPGAVRGRAVYRYFPDSRRGLL
jgi:nickel-type superoxide dismutase maturation protease